MSLSLLQPHSWEMPLTFSPFWSYFNQSPILRFLAFLPPFTFLKILAMSWTLGLDNRMWLLWLWPSASFGVHSGSLSSAFGLHPARSALAHRIPHWHCSALRRRARESSTPELQGWSLHHWVVFLASTVGRFSREHPHCFLRMLC